MSINPLIDTLNQSSRPSSAFSNFVALRGHRECLRNSATWVGGKKKNLQRCFSMLNLAF